MANSKQQDLLQFTIVLPSIASAPVYQLIEQYKRQGGMLISAGLAHHGGLDRKGRPTAKEFALSGSEFFDNYIAKNPTFDTASLYSMAQEMGVSRGAVGQALYKANRAGVIKRTAPSEYRVTGASAPPKKKPGRPPKANGAGRHKVAKGAGEAAVLTRLRRANGAAVDRAHLIAALEEAGAAGTSITGVLARLQKRKQIKKADEKGCYIAV